MSKQSFIERYKDCISTPEERSKVNMTYQIRGGAPSEALEEKFELAGSGEVHVHVSDDLDQRPTGKTTDQIDDQEVKDVLQTIGDSLDKLVSRSEANFLPDSLVGSVTIEIDGDEETFYFDVEEPVIEEEEEVDTATSDVRGDTSVQRMVHEMARLEGELLEKQ